MPIEDPGKLLKARLEKTNTSPAEFARKLGIHHTMLGRVLAGERRLGAKYASIIEDETGIPAKAWGDWYRILDERAERLAKKSA